MNYFHYWVSAFDTVGWVIWPVKPIPDMTYNEFSGTLNPTQSIHYWILCFCYYTHPVLFQKLLQIGLVYPKKPKDNCSSFCRLSAIYVTQITVSKHKTFK